MAPDDYLYRLIDDGIIYRQTRNLHYQLHAAKFSIYRDLVGFVWQESPIPQPQIQRLASAAFMEEAHNVILVGGGTRYREDTLGYRHGCGHHSQR